ncbi:MAG: phage replication initiation protein [Clostridium perfringens]|nr:phage replication initiation protein [Clostridium perfringens]
MAERRMFSKTIIDSDIFLDMPLSTQALYFHLSMRADDDGFVNNPKKIQRMIGCGDDDLKLLIAKQFIIPFESGICVIKHWRIHNYIQKDRYKPTLYQGELEQLEVDKSKNYQIKTLSTSDVYNMDTNCIQDGYNSDTQVRLGKDRLGQDRTTTVEIEEVLKNFNTDEIESISKFCSKNNVSIDVVVDKFNIIKNLKKVNNRVGALITAIKEDWKPNKGQVNNNCNFSQRDYDYDSLERQLLGWENEV